MSAAAKQRFEYADQAGRQAAQRERIAQARASSDGREGIAALLEKRKSSSVKLGQTPTF